MTVQEFELLLQGVQGVDQGFNATLITCLFEVLIELNLFSLFFSEITHHIFLIDIHVAIYSSDICVDKLFLNIVLWCIALNIFISLTHNWLCLNYLLGTGLFFQLLRFVLHKPSRLFLFDVLFDKSCHL